MKCQHCGIHFDDEERVCPMCGARAGSKGRMTRPAPKWHGKPRETYTEYHPTIENSSSAKTAKSKARPIKDKPKKNSAKGVVIAIIVIALLQIVPAIFAFVADELVPEIESSFGNSSAPEYDSDYSYEAQDLSSILGTDSGNHLSQNLSIRAATKRQIKINQVNPASTSLHPGQRRLNRVEALLTTGEGAAHRAHRVAFRNINSGQKFKNGYRH